METIRVVSRYGKSYVRIAAGDGSIATRFVFPRLSDTKMQALIAGSDCVEKCREYDFAIKQNNKNVTIEVGDDVKNVYKLPHATCKPIFEQVLTLYLAQEAAKFTNFKRIFGFERPAEDSPLHVPKVGTVYGIATYTRRTCHHECGWTYVVGDFKRTYEEYTVSRYCSYDGIAWYVLENGQPVELIDNILIPAGEYIAPASGVPEKGYKHERKGCTWEPDVTLQATPVQFPKA